MNALGDFLRQRAIDHPMLLDARFRAEGLGHDSDTKVAFSTGPRSGMAGVMMRLIDHFETGRREGRPQLRLDALADGSEICHVLIHDVVAQPSEADYN